MDRSLEIRHEELRNRLDRIIRLLERLLEIKEGEYKKLLLHYNAVTKELTEQIASLQERERVLIGRLRSYGDVETYREEALRGKKEGLPDRA